MTVQHLNQLELLGVPSEFSLRSNAVFQLAVTLDQRSWMRFLSEEWLMPDETGWTQVGVDCANGSVTDPDLARVDVWFDVEKLPALEVMVWKDNSWQKNNLYYEPMQQGASVLWPGPLPLFAVSRFIVDSKQTRAHLLSMVRNFADMTLPSQPVEVGEHVDSPTYIARPDVLPIVSAPDNWNKLRGAAAMAFATVPTIAPWLQILCDSLNSNTGSSAVVDAKAPWLNIALWNGSKRDENVQDSPLWKSICVEFSRPEILSNWIAEQILDDICARAREYGESDDLLDRLLDSTMLLLRDRGIIEDLGIMDNVVALTLQLVLLRPSPARFIGWKEDWRAIPPGAWWSGAILAGYLNGYRTLPLELRGSEVMRREVSLRTWQLNDKASFSAWTSLCAGELHWRPTLETVLIYAGKNLLTEPRTSARGQWYDVDFKDDAALFTATSIAKDVCQSNVRQTLILRAGDYMIQASGKIKFDSKRSTLTVSKGLDIPLTEGACISEMLDIPGFRAWLATASMPFRLHRPPMSSEKLRRQDVRNRQLSVEEIPSTTSRPSTNSKKAVSTSIAPLGLRIVDNFISESSERDLLKAIDSFPWDDTSMSRRVQHHGWRYDYRAKKVDPGSYLGPLPWWASNLAERLLSEGLVPEMPDQVIINEYVGAQGISKHIDCPSCFRGAIVTISLCETWEMVFSRRDSFGVEQKYKIMLPRQSATVLDGEARSQWSHEIAKKRADGTKLRQRRVSITFRKVSISR